MALRTFFTLLWLTTFGTSLSAQTIDRVEPPHWWVGMANPSLQLMVHGEDIASLSPVSQSAEVAVTGVHTTDNPNYLFIDLDLSNVTSAGTVELVLEGKGQNNETIRYTLKDRRPGSAERKGFDASDVVYLITPDRFANGNPDNDEVDGMIEGLDRGFKGGRHGGDIQGIRDHLDYIHDMGFTAIWSCPVIENQQETYSYHGYSTTDFYRIDPRMGSLDEYKALSKEAKSKGIKLIMDQIMNHMGSGHWWMDDHPSSDWVNNGWEYKWNNHYRSALHDPYSAAIDSISFTDGWFVRSMPDLNQRNPLLARYLIQNSIWWVEEADLDGIRMDTHPYPDKDFMADWSCAVMDEYPHFSLVGEEWTMNPAYIAYWQRDNARGYPSCMTSMMDFPTQKALVEALTEEDSWWGGWFKLYEAIAQDFQYAHPNDLMIFPDNHDMDRFYRQLGHDADLFKLGMTFLATTRGIPQIYYGTELLFTNTEEGDHGTIRIDFPGGWSGDSANAITGEGLSDEQLDAQQFTRRLLNWRKEASVVHAGQLTHFGPRDGVWVYFRHNAHDTVMVVLNKNVEPFSLDLDRFAEILPSPASGTEILTGEHVELSDSLALTPRRPLIIQLD